MHFQCSCPTRDSIKQLDSGLFYPRLQFELQLCDRLSCHKHVHSLAGFCATAVHNPPVQHLLDIQKSVLTNIHCCGMLVSNIMICHMMMLIIGKIFMDLNYDT